MKIQSIPIIGHVAIFVWCLFMGVTAVSIGLGAMYPPLNLVAKPLVCPNGQMTFNESTSNPLPGTTYTQIGWYCMDNRAETTTQLDIFQIALAAGPFYGLVLEALVLIAIWLVRRGNAASRDSQAVLAPARPTPATGNFSTGGHPSQQATMPADTVARMKELKQLRQQGMISESEYQQKRAEILKDL